MSLRTIQFFTEEIDYTLKKKGVIRQWIVQTVKAEGFRKTGELNFIFCNDAYLLSINQQYLDHNTYTDIITFDNSEDDEIISGDIFISLERTKENANLFNVTETHELHRVIIHGVLHLCGYLDENKKDKAQMTEKEDFYLSKLSSQFIID